ncbi:hypothetical protein QF001_000106 [Paraburkholderia youngii]
MRHRTGGLGDDCGVAGVCLGLTGVQVGNAAHRQSGQIGKQNAFIACDGQRQCADGGGLIDNEEKTAMGLEFGDEGAQFGLVVGERLDLQALAIPS